MSSEEKKLSHKEKRRSDIKAKAKAARAKPIKFQSWIKSRRSKRTKGPWKGIFRDPVKLCYYY